MKSEWTLDQWLSWLENRHVTEIQLGLSRVKQAAEALLLQSVKPIIITVAGTNGKGSTVTALASVYCAAGYRVGAYTSPHLHHFNERIAVNGKPITDKELTASFYAVDQAALTIPLTYFEITTLAALYYFTRQNLDVVVLEVGMGGRLDAVNVWDADLAIITGIDYDHQAYLGDTLEAIGYEKAGILRQGKPCIYADNQPPASIIAQVKALACPLWVLGQDYAFNEQGGCLEITHHSHSVTLPRSRLHPCAQAAAAIAVHCLQDVLPVTLEYLQQGISTAAISGRQQWIPGRVPVLLDVAHNPQSARSLAQALEAGKIRGRVHAVFSALEDKPIEVMIEALKKRVYQWYPAVLSGHRATLAQPLKQAFEQQGIRIETPCMTPPEAFQRAFDNADTEDVIIIWGSFLTVAQVMVDPFFRGHYGNH